MADHFLTDRIVVARDVCHGKPRVVGTRIMVHLVLDLLAAGLPTDTIIKDYYPDLTPADIQACIAYASLVVRNEDVVPSK